MEQTPAHDGHNADLLRLTPPDARKAIEIGCSAGAFAREYKRLNPGCHYHGVDIDADYAAHARRWCDFAETRDIDTADDAFFAAHADRDVWVFGDVLEHLRDPWRVLRGVRAVASEGAAVVACVPNAQHWSVQARLATGAFRYERQGLMDRTHLRWFTRETLLELFADCGFRIETAISRTVDHPDRARLVPALRAFAEAAGGDPDAAERDAAPIQYVLRARPA